MCVCRCVVLLLVAEWSEGQWIKCYPVTPWSQVNVLRQRPVSPQKFKWIINVNTAVCSACPPYIQPSISIDLHVMDLTFLSHSVI